MKSVSSRVAVAAITALVIGIGSWNWGGRHLAKITTDPDSEESTINWARTFAIGEGRWGIAGNYTHYQDGPSYLLVPFIMYTDLDTVPLQDAPTLLQRLPIRFRYIPLTLSAIAFAFFAGVLMFLCRNLLTRLWSALICFVILFQPGFFLWQGAIHEHSYSVSEQMFIAALALLPGNFAPLFGLLGFVSGWTGYDFFFVHLFTLMTIRAIVMGLNMPARRAVLWVASDAAALIGGYTVAILSHLVQNTLYFGSYQTALDDLFGAYGLRTSLPEGIDRTDLIQQAYQYFSWQTINAPTTFRITPTELNVAMAGGVALLGYLLMKRFHVDPLRTWKVAAFTAMGCAGMFLACTLWFVAMPHHTRQHIPIFLWRMFITPAIIAAALPVAAASTASLNLPAYVEMHLIKKTLWRLLPLAALAAMGILSTTGFI